MEIASNCIGCFVIDNGKVIDELEFQDVVKSNLLLEQGKETHEEQQLIKKYPKATVSKILKPAVISLISKDLQKLREVAIAVTKEKLKNAVKPDWLIIQASSNLDELDKSVNLLSRRLREWYELYNPEFSQATADHETFAKSILTKSKQELLKEVKAKETMGADFAKPDLDAIFNLAKQVKSLFELRKEQEAYLEILMKREVPNITAIAGILIGAKLIALAGSLERLSKFPASTVQLLGAEKALFRHLRNKRNLPPKYGILHEHGLVSKVNPINKGKMARALADKIAIAAKVDFFKGKFVGKMLMEQIEERAGALK